MEIKTKRKSFWQKRPILVTGGAGFIGSHLVKKLTELGVRVVVLDLKSSSPVLDRLERKPIWIQGNVCNFQLLKNIIKNYKINFIFHLAAQPIVDTAYFNPRQTLENNIRGTINILEAARNLKQIEGVIITSSDKAYGKALKLPYKENYPLRGDHPYDVSKSSSDLIAQAYFRTYNVPIIVSRFSNIFGPGDLNFSRVIPGVLESIIKNKTFLIRSDGKMVREYTYVEDIVDSYLSLAENIDRLSGEVINFGSKNIFSVIEAIKEVENILGAKVNYRILNIAKNEIPKQYLDWTKAQRLLDWRPKVSFEKGIRKTFYWYKNFYFAKVWKKF